MTGGLAVGGFIAGGVCGVAAVSMLVAWYEGPGALSQLLSLDALGFFAFAGGLGGLVTPLLFWSILRHVPLGEVLKWGAPLAIVGAVVGELLSPTSFHSDGPPGLIVGAIAGFVAAGIVARVLTLRRHKAAAVPPAG